MSASANGLAANAARGVLWTGGGQILRQIVQIGSQLILARLLLPGDFGLLGMALVFVGIGQLVADFGIGSAVVQARSDDRALLSSCFWLNVAVAGALTVVLLACAPLIAVFYRRADLTPIIAALSLNLLLSGLQVIPSALLYRDMRFAELARAQVVGSLVAAVAAIALAWYGAGAWALVAQPLVGGITLLVMYAAAARWRPTREFSWPLVAPLARFSASLLGTNLLGYAHRNVDTMLIGRVLGAGPLGQYSMAIQLMLFPLQQVSSVIVRVLFPTLVRIKDDLPRLRSAYLQAVSAIALVTFPIMGGLFVLADDFVLVVFGANWIEMTPVLKVLAWVGMVQSIGTTVGTIYLATGTMHIALRVSLYATPVLIAGVVAGMPWGIQGVALGYGIATFAVSIYTLGTAFKVIELSFAAFLKVLTRPLAAAMAMVGIMVAVRPALAGLGLAERFSLGVAAGSALYVVASLMVNRSQLKEMLSLLRSLRTKA